MAGSGLFGCRNGYQQCSGISFRRSSGKMTKNDASDATKSLQNRWPMELVFRRIS